MVDYVREHFDIVMSAMCLHESFAKERRVEVLELFAFRLNENRKEAHRVCKLYFRNKRRTHIASEYLVIEHRAIMGNEIRAFVNF